MKQNGDLFARTAPQIINFAAGRAGGSLYIDWNGHVASCVFFPYSKTNIKEVYANGGNLNDVVRESIGFEREEGAQSAPAPAPCNETMKQLVKSKHSIPT